MIQATQVRKGMYIRHDNDLYRVVATEHVTPGKGRGMVQAKIRHIRSGSIMDHRFRSGDRVDRIVLEEMEMEFLYKDGDTYHWVGLVQGNINARDRKNNVTYVVYQSLYQAALRRATNTGMK